MCAWPDNPSRMANVLYPRSPRETMDGWMHLPRYIDKIRLHLAGTLAPDYQPNLGKGFDGAWCAAAGVAHEQMVEVVRNSTTDGEVCDWVRQHVRKTAADKRAHGERMCSYPPPGDASGQELLQRRKRESGMDHREDIRNFVDYIDADEGRL